MATHIALSYIKDKERIISFADEISTNKAINFECSKVPINIYGNLNIIGKNKSVWLIRVNNVYGEDVYVEYNSKMCNENDAVEWARLYDRISFWLLEDQSKTLEISENYFAAFIAIKFTGATFEEIVYANELNVSGTMNVQRIERNIYHYLSVVNQGKVGGAWQIKVTNPLNKPITVFYNEKMCNEGDARNWTGLVDVKSVDLLKKDDYAILTIKDNWFATSIAISYVIDGTRVITYANQLSVNGGINIMHNYI